MRADNEAEATTPPSCSSSTSECVDASHISSSSSSEPGHQDIMWFGPKFVRKRSEGSLFNGGFLHEDIFKYYNDKSLMGTKA